MSLPYAHAFSGKKAPDTSGIERSGNDRFTTRVRMIIVYVIEQIRHESITEEMMPIEAAPHE